MSYATVVWCTVVLEINLIIQICATMDVSMTEDVLNVISKFYSILSKKY